MLNISLDLTDKFKRKRLMENTVIVGERYKPTLNDLKPSILGGWAFLRGFSYIETTHLADSNVTSIRLKAQTIGVLLETCDRCDPAE